MAQTMQVPSYVKHQTQIASNRLIPNYIIDIAEHYRNAPCKSWMRKMLKRLDLTEESDTKT